MENAFQMRMCTEECTSTSANTGTEPTISTRASAYWYRSTLAAGTGFHKA